MVVTRNYSSRSNYMTLNIAMRQGRIQDFKLGGGGGGAHLKIAPSGGRRENTWGISCEKSRFYAKKSYFSNFRGGARNFWGISCEKSRFYAKKIIFFPILGGARAGIFHGNELIILLDYISISMFF